MASSALLDLLEQAFEASDSLKNVLLPALQAQVTPSTDVKTILLLSRDLIRTWPLEHQIDFLGSHPRIGATKNLSALSNKEQNTNVTPPAVLDRLAKLNAAYEKAYPSLKFVTFVNGRTRANIVPEIETLLGLALPPPDAAAETDVVTFEATVAYSRGDEAYQRELRRGIEAMFLIALSRSGSLDYKL